MTVIVTKLAGNVTQLFNTETGRVTFKCKADSALMFIEAFGGIVKFNQKGAIATVTGHLTKLDSCDIIKNGDKGYKEALSLIIEQKKEFVKNKYDAEQQEIQELENISSLI
jgi:hypothetical protein